MQFLIAQTADDAMLAMPALHPAPSVVAISALAPTEAQLLADAWGMRPAVQA